MRNVLALSTLLLLLPAFAPAAGASTTEPNVCTYDLIESVAVCVTRDSTGRTCVIVYVGPSTPVNRCVSPRDAVGVSDLCAEPAAYDVGVCVSAPKNYVCVEGHWGHYPFGECVYIGPAALQGSTSVDLYCKVGDRDCVGHLACAWETRYTPEVCVPDPCYTTSCWRADAAYPKCVVIVPEGGDMGEKVCVDPSAECKVWYQRTTFIGTWTLCLVPPGQEGGDPTESPAPFPCADRYWELDLVVAQVVSRSTCQYEVCTTHDGRCYDVLA